jgi:serine/threonine protein phosphatase PrpC
VHLEIGVRTDTGRVRENNEDSFASEPDISLFVVSDGMGGAEHGEVASAIAVSAVAQHCRSAISDPALPVEGSAQPSLAPATNRLLSAVRCAHNAIYRLAASDPALRGMGATIVAAWVQEETLSLAHVGDSRAYRLRSGRIEQLTHDHSLVAEQVRLGLLTSEQAAESRLQTILTRALGHSENVEVDAQEHAIQDGDTFLLCSDGLSRMVPDPTIAAAIEESLGLQAASERLIEMANRAGGEDNITALLFRAHAKPRGWFPKVWR